MMAANYFRTNLPRIFPPPHHSRPWLLRATMSRCSHSPPHCMVLKKRLKWQMDHQSRGLTYEPIDLATAKLMVFTDGSFANNKDLSSQLGFVIALVNETERSDNEFKVTGSSDGSRSMHARQFRGHPPTVKARPPGHLGTQALLSEPSTFSSLIPNDLR